MHQKRCQGGRRLHCQLPQSVFEEDEAGETAEKKIKNQKKKTKNSKKDCLKKKKNWTSFFLFFEIAPKKVPKGTPSTSSAPSKCF